jgi:hypothetical protein
MHNAIRDMLKGIFGDRGILVAATELVPRLVRGCMNKLQRRTSDVRPQQKKLKSKSQASQVTSTSTHERTLDTRMSLRENLNSIFISSTSVLLLFLPSSTILTFGLE